jgi:Secretion system C-terminal sorting domain
MQTQNGLNVDVTMDIQFTASTNGGNKQVFFHVWKENQYPSATMHPNPFNCTGNQSVAPAPAKINSGQNLIDILDNAFLNFGFNVNAISTFPTFSSVGITANYSAYDGTVVLNSAGAQISKEAAGTDVDIIRIKNLTFTIPNYSIGDFLQVRAFNWATNGTGGKPQCWGCGQVFTIGDPVISGSISCAQPGGSTQPTYNLFIDSKYDDLAIAGIQTISGKYVLYTDVSANGLSNDDILIKDTVYFTTSTAGVPFGFNSRYSIFNAPFDYSFANGDPNSSKPVLAKVIVSTIGYLGAGAVGTLTNQCATLPVSLKNFNAAQRSGKGFLTWETDQENNNDGFEIERRSAGNSQYQKIGFVDSKAPGGTGAAFSYSFDDNQSLAKGVTYYRLRQVDLDGRATYSEVKAVRTGNGGLLTISIYPNPSRGTTNITIPESAGKMDVSLDDFTGKSIQRWSGISVRNLQLNNMKPGIYMLRINFRESGETIVERIIVQ